MAVGRSYTSAGKASPLTQPLRKGSDESTQATHPGTTDRASIGSIWNTGRKGCALVTRV